MERRVEIFCPKCQFHPCDADRWLCACGSLWNTFDTNGTCPDCGKLHKDTQCPSCGKWSPHPDWYHEFNSDTVEAEKELVEPATS